MKKKASVAPAQPTHISPEDFAKIELMQAQLSAARLASMLADARQSAARMQHENEVLRSRLTMVDAARQCTEKKKAADDELAKVQAEQAGEMMRLAQQYCLDWKVDAFEPTTLEIVRNPQ